jgi:hypothetical protein
MRREALLVGDRAGPAEPLRQARDQMAPCDGEPVRRHDAGVMAIADREALLKIVCTSRAKVVRG